MSGLFRWRVGACRPLQRLASRALGAALLVSAVAAGDAHAQQFVRVSVATGGAQANRASAGSTWSANGRFVGFYSDATNLVPSDTNASKDVFVRDLVANETTRVSVASDGTDHAGDSGDLGISLSADAGFVAFASRAALVADDTNSCSVLGHDEALNCSDIYVHERATGQTTRVSVASDGSQANGESRNPHISADGRFIVFSSTASNLVQGDLNGVEDVFLHDRVSHTTTRLSVSSSGNDLAARSYGAQISGDGQIVAFVSEAAIVESPGPIGCPFAGSCGRAFILDRTTGLVTGVPVLGGFLQTDPTAPVGATVQSVVLTSDGRFLAVGTVSTHAPTFNTPSANITILDRLTGREWVAGSGLSANVTLSDNGRYAAIGGNVIFPSGSPGAAARFDLVAGRGILFPPPFDHFTAQSMTPGAFSPDGLRVLLDDPTPLVPGDTNNVSDVYLLNRDVDGDGMEDDWETLFGLNPNDPADATLDPDGDGKTNLQEYVAGTNPKGTFKRYFAEGAANAFFSTRFALFNPGDQAATVTLEFLGSNGQSRSTTMTLPSHFWEAVTLTDTTALQPDNDFSTIIEADQPVVADRTMTWDKTGYGSHAETAIEAPGTTWYLAEGSTGGGFDLFYLLQNPGDTVANVTVTYLRPAPAPLLVRTYPVAPRSRRTLYVDQEGLGLAETDVSAKITSDQPILVERAMYYSTPSQPFAAGHEGAAVAAPATSWFLAEGATGSFFDLFVLIANAETTDAQVKVTYLLADGAPIIKNYAIPAQSRVTINVDGEDPRLLDTPVSTIVESTNAVPVIVERAMWWPSPNWYEAHLSAGATTTGTRWALAEGLVVSTPGSETETYILVANTSATAGAADVTLYFGDATTQTTTVALPANSRVSIPVSATFPTAANHGGFGTIIQSNGPQIVVERAMYSNANGQTWAAGTDALATRLQ